MDSVRACSCEAVEIAHRQSQWLDCEALVPPRVRSSSARRASKKMVDLDRYRGPLAVLVGANFHSGDDFSIEGRTAGGRRKCMNSAKGRGFNTLPSAGLSRRPGFRGEDLAFAPPSKHALPLKEHRSRDPSIVGLRASEKEHPSHRGACSFPLVDLLIPSRSRVLCSFRFFGSSFTACEPPLRRQWQIGRHS